MFNRYSHLLMWRSGLELLPLPPGVLILDETGLVNVAIVLPHLVATAPLHPVGVITHHGRMTAATMIAETVIALVALTTGTGTVR